VLLFFDTLTYSEGRDDATGKFIIVIVLLVVTAAAP